MAERWLQPEASQGSQASGVSSAKTEELVGKLTSQFLRGAVSQDSAQASASSSAAPPAPPAPAAPPAPRQPTSLDQEANSTLQNLLKQVLPSSQAPAPQEEERRPETPSAAASLQNLLSSASAPSRPRAPPVPGTSAPPGSFLPAERPRPPPSIPQDAGAADEEQEEQEAEADDGDQRRSRPSREARPRLTFDKYLEEKEWMAGLASGKYIKGTLRASTTKLKTAHVIPEGCKPKERDLAVIGKKCRNRAVHGDVVICELLPDKDKQKLHEEDDEDEHDKLLRPPPGLSLPEDSDSSDEEVMMSGAVLAAEEKKSASSSKGGRDRQMPKLGKVVAIAERKGSDRVIVCTLHPNDVGTKKGRDAEEVKEDDRFIKAKPTDKRMPWILVQINDVTRKVLNLPGRLDKFQLWPVQMVAWSETASLPLGRLKGQCLGAAGDLEAEEKHALMENGLDVHDEDFPDELLDEVDAVVTEANRNFESEAARRQDLRSKRVFTIDPATARDLDDAIHVDDLGDTVEIGVHIADVGHFVKLGSKADVLAQSRTTSVYLINRVLPMLPHALCNHLCSLNPNEPKLAFTAHFRLDKNTGELLEDGPNKPRFSKTAICSCCRMNYNEVQVVLDDGDLESDKIPAVYGDWSWREIREDIFLLYDVCGKVRRGRMEGGALSISKQKMIFHTRESEDGAPTGYHLESHSASHWIIEELMLLANRCVAKFLALDPRLNEVGVLRKHDPPDPKKAEGLDKLLRENLRIDWNQGNAHELHMSCQAVRQKYGDMLGLCVDMMVMRSGMKQAEYFVYDDSQSPHHFALNFDYYTHFTSPIRRYPDVMVHRVLAAILTGQDDEFQQREDSQNQVEICNEKKSATRKSSEQIDRAVFCIFLRRMKAWFYTIGTVLSFHKDTNEGGTDTVTVYCSQLGKESKARLCPDGELASMELITEGIDDELIMPLDWKFKSRGALELRWPDPENEGRVGKKQLLRTLSCVPVVIIPTNTVPVDYAVFFVSPLHKKAEGLRKRVPAQAEEGFEWIEPEEEGVSVIHDAHAAPLGEGD